MSGVANGRTCRFCDAPLRHTFVDLGMSPLCESYRARRPSSTRWSRSTRCTSRVCEQCFLVQLDEYVPREEIFSEYAYFSSYSDSLGRARAPLRRG